MTEISTTSARNAAFYLIQALSWFGMYLIWFQGDQSTNLVLPFFGLQVGVVFLSASFWLTESGTARNLAVRTIGTFFLFTWIEEAVCLVPPRFGGNSNVDVFIGNRYRSAYVGAVFILISVFLSFALSYLQFAAPSNAGSRIASLRGLLYVVAIGCCIVSSAISWSWKPACTLGANGVIPANAIMILNAWIILASLLHGDGESDSVALAINAAVLYVFGPVFFYDDSVTVQHKRHKAQVAILFIGAWCFILGVVLDRILNDALPLAARVALGIKERLNKFDILALVLGIAGAVCTYARNETDQEDYEQSYAFIIPLLSIVGVLTGTTAPKIAVTFLSFWFVQKYDNGSTTVPTGYTRGGLLMSQGAVLLTVFSNAIRGRDLNNVVAFPSGVAIAQFVVGACYVPSNYSRYFIVAMTVMAAEVFDDADYGRVAYIMIVWNGFARHFLLTISGTPTVLQIINFASAAVFIINYLKAGAKQAPGLKFGNDMNAPIEAVVEAVKEAA